MQDYNFVLEVVRLTNEYRAANGLSSLFIDFDLQEAAQGHSQNMANQDFFSHTDLAGNSSQDRARSAGYESGTIGENIAVGYRTPQSVVNGWIDSPSHRENLLNANYNEIGVGYYFLENDTGNERWNTYWTQVFGRGDIETPFDALQYGASHPDLMQVFGLNPGAFLQHYTENGQFEGRALDLFDEYHYLASNVDLLAAFQGDGNAATQHYIAHGYAEGRSIDSFNPAQYLASHDDLLGAFGNNYDAATQHYAIHGYSENRSQDSFAEDLYIASNSDLIRAFGYNLNVATEHYINHGWSEQRSIDSFNAAAYLGAHSDLQNAFGNDLGLATRHYIEYGYFEGR